jgi:hypothetical protein
MIGIADLLIPGSHGTVMSSTHLIIFILPYLKVFCHLLYLDNHLLAIVTQCYIVLFSSEKAEFIYQNPIVAH